MRRMLISHDADIDGMGSAVLCDLAFGGYEYILLGATEINSFLVDGINCGNFDEIDFIYVCDLTVTKETCDVINDSNIADKILIFDHHLPSDELGCYSFNKSYSSRSGVKCCGTSLFYEYLLENFSNDKILKDSTKEFVELIRLNDTWDWKLTNNTLALDLSSIHSLYGNDVFIETFSNRLTDYDEFKFSDEEEYYLYWENEKKKAYIIDKETQMFTAKLDGYKVGVVFAERYRSELGSYLAEKNKDDLDFIVLINISRSISFRGVDKVDLNKVAEVFGGHGHKNASGASLPDKILESVAKEIFKEKIELC